MANGQFNVSNGEIIAPDGTDFLARGIDVFPGQVDGNTILATFPGINMVRVAATPSTDPATISALVQTLTAKNVVVEIEDHSSSGGDPNTLSGAALASEESWYGSLASTYKTNPYVWFGTANEPDNTADMSAISTQEQGIYNAIRGAGDNSPIMLEMRGGFTNDFARAVPSIYASMHNVVWDTHFYGWVPNYSTDPATIATALRNQIADAQSVQSADGIVPVIIGEYGISTTGASVDPNGTQVVQAVESSGYGALAWAWNAGVDALTSGFDTLTAYGQQVAAYIASSSPPPSKPTPSPDNTVITAAQAAQGASITDASGNVWSIASNGEVSVNGTPDGQSANVIELAYEKGLIWQENSQDLWWSKASPSGTWAPAGGTSTSPIPVASSSPPPSKPIPSPDNTVITAAQAAQGASITDASGNVWSIASNGEVSVNGTPDGQSANVIELAYEKGLIWQENSQDLWWSKASPSGTWAPAGGTSTSPVPVAVSAHTITLELSEDAYKGNAQFVAKLDGNQIGGGTVTALHSAGQTQAFTYNVNLTPGQHSLEIDFINDAYAGPGKDRNLYVNQVQYDGHSMLSAVAPLYQNGGVVIHLG